MESSIVSSMLTAVKFIRNGFLRVCSSLHPSYRWSSQFHFNFQINDEMSCYSQKSIFFKEKNVDLLKENQQREGQEKEIKNPKKWERREKERKQSIGQHNLNLGPSLCSHTQQKKQLSGERPLPWLARRSSRNLLPFLFSPLFFLLPFSAERFNGIFSSPEKVRKKTKIPLCWIFSFNHPTRPRISHIVPSLSVFDCSIESLIVPPPRVPALTT